VREKPLTFLRARVETKNYLREDKTKIGFRFRTIDFQVPTKGRKSELIYLLYLSLISGLLIRGAKCMICYEESNFLDFILRLFANIRYENDTKLKN
jgi:hypothetical protein